MKKIFHTLLYYSLLLLGLIWTSWIIWSRFLRQRVIRDIPDAFLTEYRVWILIYICYIYLSVIKNLIKPTETRIDFSFLTTYLWKPLTTLDHFIKYNKYCKPYYENFIIKFIDKWDILSTTWKHVLILGFSVIPRIILVTVLFLDTFYFHKIEIFYKFVLIGLLPFLFRYIQYSVKDFYNYLVKQLTDKYDQVHIFEKGYPHDISRRRDTQAIWHHELVSIEKYIEIMHDIGIEFCNLEPESKPYEYVGYPYCKEEVYKQYRKEFNKTTEPWTTEEIKQTTALFEELIPQILDLKLTLGLFELDKQKKVIVWPKIFIFSMYFLCWSYILIISYYNYPIELPMFKIFIKNILMYLTIGEDLFIDNIYSVNENLVTIENMKLLILGIVKVIIKVIINLILKIIKTKKQLILIIVLISIVIICSILMHKYYTYNEEQIFIKNCIEDCLKDVYGYMTHNINKNYYGCLKVYIGNEKHSMLSSYYEILINKENIENYLKSLNWQEIITMKKKNIAAIKEYVIEGYTEHMKKPEEIYTVNILINTNIKEIKTDLTNILKIRAANIINSDEFIAKFLNDIDWNLYLRTMEFKNKTYVKLVEIFDKKVQEKEHQQIQEA